ncbi:hypothetical protein FIBSPDRAFT_946819 [Athelia psychrophila]|uniref:Uncharacterized protein n=1 Tax=Athelia psychrophila TaxID=1759441 RepID=A0A166SKV3_9AGAM|nr:hypothetical protein FIBSPDRAFT_946819 [Fibularhizoctonia sp. CBS 109695]
MSNIIYPDCHCDDQTLNNLLASLRLDAPSRQIPPRAPLVPTRPRLVPTDYPSPSPSRPPITSGSAISNEHHTTPPSAHTSFGSPVDPPRPLDSPPPYPNFDPADIACWERDPDINPFGPLERTYNMSVGSETGIIHTWGSHSSIPIKKIGQHSKTAGHRKQCKLVSKRLAAINATAPSNLVPGDANPQDDEPSSLPSTWEPDHIASPIESDPEDDSSDADVSPSVNYSLGEDGDALADSLARALRSTESDFEDEIPLPDEQYGEECYDVYS